MAESILSFAGDYWFWGSVGFIIGSALCIHNMVKNGCPFPVAVIAITVGIYGGLIATRVLYVLIFYPRLFIDSLPLALAFWQQTGTWFGAPIGGAIGISLVLLISRQPTTRGPKDLGMVAPLPPSVVPMSSGRRTGLELCHPFRPAWPTVLRQAPP